MHRRIHLALLLFIAMCSSASAVTQTDAVLEWNEIMLTALTGQSPANEARLAAITQVAVFEAVNAITGRYQPYLGTIAASRSASADAATVAAAHTVLRHYVPAKASDLDGARAQSLASILNGPAKEEGIAAGEAAAAAMIALRANDGSTPAQFYQPTSSDAGAWQITPGCPPEGGVFLNWREVTPFGIRNARQFRAEPPPPLTSRRYAIAYNEVKEVGAAGSTARPQDRADVARFYAVEPATRIWNRVARQVAIARGHTLSQNARTLALLNISMSDAVVAVVETKYRALFWRPETAIHAGDVDGNRATRGDPDFVPFIATPCHPSYASGHASASYAARAVLESIHGGMGHFVVLSSPALPGVNLEYRRFEQITRDIDDARIYGGIHFRFDQEAGARQGCRIGEYIRRHYFADRATHSLEPESAGM